MKTEKEFEAFSASVRTRLEQYEKQYEEAVKQEKIWKDRRLQSCASARKKLDEYLYSVRPEALCKKIKKKVEEQSKKENIAVYNLAKFIYYVDMINAKKTPQYIIKHNPKYCDKVIKTLAEEYCILTYWINNREKSYKDYYTQGIAKARSEQRTMVEKEVNQVYSEIDELAECEADRILNSFKDLLTCKEYARPDTELYRRLK